MMLPTALFCLLLAACSDSSGDKDDPEGSTDDGGSTDGTTDTTDTTDTGVGAVEVEDVVDLPCGYYEDAEQIVAVAPSAGTVDVTHLAFAIGCFPERVIPTVTVGKGELNLTYEVVNDFVDCVCSLGVTYRIINVPAGDWSLVSTTSGLSTPVTVP